MLKLESVELHVANGSEDISILKDINLELEDNKFYALTAQTAAAKPRWPK